MVLQLQVWALMLLQEAGPAVGFDLRSMWAQMTWPARIIVIVLFVMSAWSIGVMIDRVIAFNGARNQSRQFAPAVAGALREGKLDEAIKIADRYSKSHLAKVVVAGLQEFRAHQMSSEISGEEIEASRRALERYAVDPKLIERVAGFGDTVPLPQTPPEADANERMTISLSAQQSPKRAAAQKAFADQKSLSVLNNP